MAVSISGNTIIGGKWQVGAIIPLLLDTYSGAAAAYSLRKLSSSYTGSAIRVRRSNDNAEQDIGFTSTGDLDETALTTFTGANSGYVTKWYDQSGNSIDAAQTTAANQPRIVNSGTIDKVNSKPTLYFDGTNDGLLIGSSISSSGAWYTFSIHKRISNATSVVLFSNSTNNGPFSLIHLSNDRLYIANRTAIAYVSNSELNQLLITTYSASSSALYLYKNGTLLSTTSSNDSYPYDFNSIGFRAVNNSYGYIQEAIIYLSDKSSSKTAIESNINQYYNIY